MSDKDCEDPTLQKLNSSYSRPILMQHFPLFRKSDEDCGAESGALPPTSILKQKLRPRMDCLSKESTRFLTSRLRPRGAFGGHSHYGCRKWWPSPDNLWEHTVPSFSWRNNHRPSFLLLTVSPSEINVESCTLPDEYLVLGLYVGWICYWLMALLLRVRWRRPVEFKTKD